MSPLSPTTTAITPAMTPDPARLAALRGAAVAFEASFLAEMLKAAGFGRPIEGLGGGGAGEEAFASLLVREQATRMAEAGGIGLAESVFRALVAREGALAGLSDA
jgi:peptidoglycan hydrolase FlgJ